MNTLYNELNNGIIGQFQQFQSRFQGDPRAEVQRLMQSGQMTQAQYNELSNRAQMLYSMLKH